jgi:hypothetical protein
MLFRSKKLSFELAEHVFLLLKLHENSDGAHTSTPGHPTEAREEA